MTSNLSREPKQHLFVCGPPRSGTTAIMRVLHSHERIGIGMERFKSIMNRKNIDLFTPALFEKDKFFDFNDGYTNIIPEVPPGPKKRFYDDMEANFDNLSFIGDKVPGAFHAADLIHERFPSAKFVFIIRDIVETACSWQVRAERQGDSWPASKNAIHAVKPWNACLKKFIRLKSQFPDDFYMVDYRSFFDGDPKDMRMLDALCEFIDLPADSSMCEGFSSARKKYTNSVKDKPRVLDEATLRYLEEHADWKAHEKAIGATAINEFKNAA